MGGKLSAPLSLSHAVVVHTVNTVYDDTLLRIRLSSGVNSWANFTAFVCDCYCVKTSFATPNYLKEEGIQQEWKRLSKIVF